MKGVTRIDASDVPLCSAHRNRSGWSFEREIRAWIGPPRRREAPALRGESLETDAGARQVEFVVTVVRRVVKMLMSGFMLVRVELVMAVPMTARERSGLVAIMRREEKQIV
jgi:hypothetical protein